MTALSRDKTLVLVEDDPDISDLMAMILRTEGYRVETAANGVSGYNLCRTVSPDLVLLDVMLPGMDGLELYDLLQHDEQTREIPVIFASARCRTADQMQALRAGLTIIDFLAKPFGMDELVLRVELALYHRPLSRRDDEKETGHDT
jgi:DNA-binding response OmpR family regulator